MKHFFSSPKLNLYWNRAWNYAFWDHQMQTFVRQGTAPLQQTKIIYLYRFWPKKGLKFGIFCTPIVEFSYASPCNPQNSCPKSLLYTDKFNLLIWAWNYACFLTKYKFSYTRGRCLGPCQGLSPGSHQGFYRRAWTLLMGSCASHLMFLSPSNS